MNKNKITPTPTPTKGTLVKGVDYQLSPFKEKIIIWLIAANIILYLFGSVIIGTY